MPKILHPLTAIGLAACHGATACGFGSSSPGPRVPDPEPPTVLPRHATAWTENTAAADLSKQWHRNRLNTALTDSLALAEPASSPPARFPFASVQPIGDSAAPPLRTADPADITVLGATDRFTVGRWTQGPADTLPIHFAWSLSEAPAHIRALTARAGRNIGRNLRNDIGEQTLQEGAPIQNTPMHAVPTLSWPQDVTANGVIVAVTPPAQGASPTGGALEYSYSDGEFHPFVGRINFGPTHYENSRNLAGSYVGSYYVASHELMHVLGISSRVRGGYIDNDGRRVTHHPCVDVEAGTWNGPNAVAVHGGPVPYRRRPDGSIDFAHLGEEACPTVVGSFAACADYQDWPATVQTVTASRLDLAYLADLGYELLDPETAAAPEVYGLGAWNDDAAWGITVARDLEANPRLSGEAPSYDGWIAAFLDDRVAATADAFGTAPSQSFVDTHHDMTGEAAWTGILLGVDLADDGLAPVTGNASLTIDLATLGGHAVFDNLTVLDQGASQRFRRTDLMYEVTASGNGFQGADGRIHGQWYGSDHGTMAGTLKDTNPAVELLAGFGGSR